MHNLFTSYIMACVDYIPLGQQSNTRLLPFPWKWVWLVRHTTHTHTTHLPLLNTVQFQLCSIDSKVVVSVRRPQHLHLAALGRHPRPCMFSVCVYMRTCDFYSIFLVVRYNRLKWVIRLMSFEFVCNYHRHRALPDNSLSMVIEEP